MLDLDTFRIFERVAALKSFTAAARALGLPKSNVSRAIAKLEGELGTRLFQRTTRDVGLTLTGEALLERSAEITTALHETLAYVRGLSGQPRGVLKVSAGMGFGVNVLAGQLPDFLLRYPEIHIALDLESRAADLVGEAVDVAVRLGPLPDSDLVVVKLGEMRRFLCASPAYLARSGTPASLHAVSEHDTIEMPSPDGRIRPWVFSRGEEVARIDHKPRISVNEALTISRLVLNGAGIGVLSGYICGPHLAEGRLVHLFPEWTAPPVEVSLVFPSRRQLSPMVRAFVDFMKETSGPDALWMQGYDPGAQ